MALQSRTITVGADKDVNNGGKNYVSGQVIYIKDEAGVLAPIFRDIDGLDPIAQNTISNVTNAKGQFTFFVEEGNYIAEYNDQSTPIFVFGADYFNNRIDESVQEIMDRTPYVVGNFADGFTYDAYGQVGVDASGNAWAYVGVGAPNKVVTAGTVPSVPDYKQVAFSDLQQLTGLNLPSGLDDVYSRTVSLQEALSEYVEVGKSYVINDLGYARYDVVPSSDTGGFYVGVNQSGNKLKLHTTGEDVKPVWGGVLTDGTEGVKKNHEIMQELLDSGYKSFDFGGSNNRYIFSKCFGLPDQGFYQENTYNFKANGAKVDVQSPTALITSKTVCLNNGVGTGANSFAGKVFIKGFNFIGQALSGVVDGDFIYNVHFDGNHCEGLSHVFRSYQSKTGGYPSGYFQSVYITNNEFISCDRVLSGKRAFNVVVKNNSFEACGGGLYIDGDGQPAINNIRVRDNVFEGGGLFCSFGDAICGVIDGNYTEKNLIGDVVTKKCHIDLSYKGGSQFYDWTIKSNSAQDTPEQVSDNDFQLVSFEGAEVSGNFNSVLLQSNWTTSRVTNFTPIYNSAANREGSVVATTNLPSTPQSARVDFRKSLIRRSLAANLTGDNFKAVTLEIPDGNFSNRDLSLDLSVLMRGQTAGLVTTCAALVVVRVLISAVGSGVAVSRLPDYHSVSATLVSITQQPNGTIIDKVDGYTGTVMFPSEPTVSTQREGDKVHILLSGFSPASTANYGSVSEVETSITAQANCFAGNVNTASRWVEFTQ